MHWGDAPTWVGAVFLGAAALTGLFQLGRQRKELGAVRLDLQKLELQNEELNLQLEPERIAARRSRRKQAEQVDCSRREDQIRLEGNATGPSAWDYLLVTNTSDEPIRTVNVSFGGEGPFGVGHLERQADGLVLVGRVDWPVPVINPGGEWCFLQPGNVDPGNAAVLVRFDDANGVRWQANLVGQLDGAHDETPEGKHSGLGLSYR